MSVITWAKSKVQGDRVSRVKHRTSPKVTWPKRSSPDPRVLQPFDFTSTGLQLDVQFGTVRSAHEDAAYTGVPSLGGDSMSTNPAPFFTLAANGLHQGWVEAKVSPLAVLLETKVILKLPSDPAIEGIPHSAEDETDGYYYNLLAEVRVTDGAVEYIRQASNGSYSILICGESVIWN